MFTLALKVSNKEDAETRLSAVIWFEVILAGCGYLLFHCEIDYVFMNNIVLNYF